MLGTVEVNKPSGMEVLNSSINSLVNEVPEENWREVIVSVAPSTISISFVGSEERSLECR